MTKMVDSRLQGFTGRVTHPTLPLERTYCAHCGKPKGWVSVGTMGYIRVLNIIVICDDCELKLKKLGPIPLLEAPIKEIA